MVKNLARQYIMEPFQAFAQQEASGGVVLVVVMLTALLWANSPWHQAYVQMWQTPLAIGLPGFSLALPLHGWINDGLMAVFFLLVGLEIKRELLVGELSDPRQASLPMMAALGGMVVPGLIYMLINPPGSAFGAGWGIPMVTDIAFSLGVLALLGKRIPLFLKVFLAALAIVDDLGAVLIIALFYSSGLHWAYLGIAACLMGVLLILNRCRVRCLSIYLLLGAGLWVALWYSGIHSTMAGVLVAAATPASVLQKEPRVMCASDEMSAAQPGSRAGSSPLHRLEQSLHPWVTYGVMPLFVLANAGVVLSADTLGQDLAHPIALAVVAGLVLGKPIGITLFSWFSVRCGLASLPDGIRWVQLYGLACLGGIGFTMSLFIADLAFGNPLADTAKVGILVASLVSGLWGGFILLKSCRSPER